MVTVEQITNDAWHSVEISYFPVTQILTETEFNFEGSRNSKNAVSANFWAQIFIDLVNSWNQNSKALKLFKSGRFWDPRLSYFDFT